MCFSHWPCQSHSSCSLAGVSRSVTLVVAYIMTVTGLGWQEALAAVKVARPCAGPNLGFQRQLHEFETTQADTVSMTRESGNGVAWVPEKASLRSLNLFLYSVMAWWLLPRISWPHLFRSPWLRIRHQPAPRYPRFSHWKKQTQCQLETQLKPMVNTK